MLQICNKEAHCLSFKIKGYPVGTVLVSLVQDAMDTLKQKIQGIEREEIFNALRECNWVMARAARKLGITERMIGYKVMKYGIRIKEVQWIEHRQQGAEIK